MIQSKIKKDNKFEEGIYNRKPPQAIEFEEAVLGAIMLEKNALPIVMEILRPQSFYVEAHKKIYEAILELFSQAKPVDVLTVTDALQTKGKLNKVGGAYYLVELTNKVGSSAHVEYHSRIIAEKSVQRDLIEICSKGISLAYEETSDAFELLEDLQYDLHAVNKNLSKKKSVKQLDLANNVIAEMFENNDNKTGVNTGFSRLNAVTGGWQKSDVIVVAARPGKGKSALMMNFIHAAASTGDPVHVFSLEMQNEQLMKRYLSAQSEVQSDFILNKHLNEIDKKRIEVGYSKILNLPIVYDDTSGMNAIEIKSKLIDSIRTNGTKIAIIDYLGKMRAINKDSKGNRFNTVSDNICAIKDVAKDLDIPIIVLAQMSRNIEYRKGEEPELADLRDSGEIEQEASVVIFIHTPIETFGYEAYEEFENGDTQRPKTKEYTQLLVKKNRNGRLGRIHTLFNKPLSLFSEIQPINFKQTNISFNQVVDESLPF